METNRMKKDIFTNLGHLKPQEIKNIYIKICLLITNYFKKIQLDDNKTLENYHSKKE